MTIQVPEQTIELQGKLEDIVGYIEGNIEIEGSLNGGNPSYGKDLEKHDEEIEGKKLSYITSIEDDLVINLYECYEDVGKITNIGISYVLLDIDVLGVTKASIGLKGEQELSDEQKGRVINQVTSYNLEGLLSRVEDSGEVAIEYLIHE